MSRRLLWASPWNEMSAIASFGWEVIRELEQMGFEVDVLRTELGSALDLPPLAARALYSPADLTQQQILETYDAVVLNLGNHFPFHGGGVELLQANAPLVILHDAWMGDFFWGWRQALSSGGGNAGGFLPDLGSDPSGMTAVCGSASAAVVHGPHYRELVEAACPGPVASIPLAFTFAPLAPPPLTGQRLVVATVGHINPNKRVDQVIRALGLSSSLRANTNYLLMGPVSDDERSRLLQLARRWRAPTPHFTGWLADADLRAMLESVDVICCLRDPCLEGGSASLITAMLSARPTLVSNQAHYAELPDDLVLKCAPGDEAADVIQHLEWVLDNPVKARDMGRAASEFALATRSPSAYAHKLAPVVEESIARAPIVRAARRLGARLAPVGIPPDDPACERVAANFDDLLGA